MEREEPDVIGSKNAAINPKDIEDGFLAFCWQNLAPEARARILAKAPKTFWLFGAGASHHYDLNAFRVRVPLASGFFKAYHLLPISQGFDYHVGPFNNFLEEYRGVTPETIGQFDENIEAFMTSVESELEKIRETANDHLTRDEYAHALSYAMVFTNMNFIFASVLNEAQNGASMSLYRTLLEFCGPNDLFVTFNWDTLLDRALLDTGGWNPNTGYGLSFRAVLDGSWKNVLEGDAKFATNWKLIKLHGSTNWLVPHMGVDFKEWKLQTTVAGYRRCISLLVLCTSVCDAQEPLERWLCSNYLRLLPSEPTCRVFYQRTAFCSSRKRFSEDHLAILVPIRGR